MNKPVKVCMISSLHGLYDDRIYWKEALSLKKHGYDLIHIGVGEEDKDFFSEHGIRLIQVRRKKYFQNPYYDKLFKIFTLRSNVYGKILKICETINADVYHFHDYQLNRIGPSLKKLHKKPKVIYDVHEPYPEIARYLQNGLLNKAVGIIQSFFIKIKQIKASKSYDLIITTEENVADEFKKHLSDKKVTIIYNYFNFINTDNFRRTKIEYDLIYTGGISRWRGIFELLQTARLAKIKNIDLKILFIGIVKEKGLKEKIEKYISVNKLEKYFEIKNFVPHHEIMSYYQKSRIGICIFSNNPVYQVILPIKIFEYMASGLPVICNDFGHASRIVNNEGCGITISENKPEEILGKVLLIKNDDKTYIKFSENGKKASHEKFNWKLMEDKLLMEYQNILSI